MASSGEQQQSQGESQPQDEGQPQEAAWAPAPHRRRWLWIALSAAVAVAGVAALNVPGNSNAFPAAAGAPVSAPAAAAASRPGPGLPNPDATEPVPAAVPSPARVATSARSSHLPPKLAASLASWKAGSGGATLAALSIQLNSATQADGLRLYATMRLACTQVGNEVTAARAGPPIPDATMQGWYARALATLASAAADCRAGISVHPYGDEDIQAREYPKALNRSTAEFATGAVDLFRATAKINSLSQH
jgi:hypothetical protein